jgi:uncharacterized protein (DUF2236 family)
MASCPASGEVILRPPTMADFFPRGAVIRRVSMEPALMFGAGRALLLQLAHAPVAQAVQDHSDFKGHPFRRLLGTLEATSAVVFGSETLARDVGARIHRMHEHVTGATYRANDPANLLWVHATLVDTALLCYTRLVEPLSAADRETYYQEMTRVAEVFGIRRADQPPTLAAFEAYFREMVGKLDVTAVGRDLMAFILAPTFPLALHVPLRPLLSLQRLFTLGLTPPRIRDQLGLDWDARAERRFDRAERAIRTTFDVLPRTLRTAGSRISGGWLLDLAARHTRSRGDIPAPPTHSERQPPV